MARQEDATIVPSERLSIVFVEVEATDVATYEGSFVVMPESAGGGEWAAIPHLDRPERARASRPGRQAGITVALFRADGEQALLSAGAAAALGITGARAHLRLVALRREPRLAGS